MLVLLIIFMVTAPMMQQGLEVELPETSASGAETTEDPLMLVINKKAEIFIADQQIPLSDLQKRLSAIFQTRDNKQVYLQADKSVHYGAVAEAMGEIRAAGIFNISLVTLPK